MIFLSHNSKDKDFVNEIAYDLEKEFGKGRVFYDNWSIKPGESIPGAMSDGLEKVTHFFYFLTKNSIESTMVEAEWHAAFIKHANDRNVKFIVVRADEINPPALLAPLKYLDLYINGISNTTQEMIEIINEKWDGSTKVERFKNIIAYFIKRNNELIFFVTAKRFFEPNAPFIILTESQENECSFEPGWPAMHGTQFTKDIVRDGKTNGFCLDVQTDIRPGSYLKLIFRKRINSVNIKGLFHSKSSNNNVPIELIEIYSESELP